MPLTSVTAPAIGGMKWIFVVSTCRGTRVHCQLVPPPAPAGGDRRASLPLVSSLVICFVILFTLSSFAAYFGLFFQMIRRGPFRVCGV